MSELWVRDTFGGSGQHSNHTPTSATKPEHWYREKRIEALSSLTSGQVRLSCQMNFGTKLIRKQAGLIAFGFQNC